jgi:hypothetical protein
MIAGTFVPTLWVNVMMIWFMTILLYVLLYFRVFKKLLDSTGQPSAGKASVSRSE